MDKMRQMLQQEQQNQLETLIQSSGSLPLPPSNRYSIGSTVAEHTVEAHDEISSEGNDRITFYPPVFVWLPIVNCTICSAQLCYNCLNISNERWIC